MRTSKTNLRYDDYLAGIKGLRPEEQLSLIKSISVQLKKNIAEKKNGTASWSWKGLGLMSGKALMPGSMSEARGLRLFDKLTAQGEQFPGTLLSGY